MGASLLQCPHQGAYNLTIQVNSANIDINMNKKILLLVTSVSKLSSVRTKDSHELFASREANCRLSIKGRRSDM